MLVVLIDDEGRPIDASSPMLRRNVEPDWFVQLLGVRPELVRIPLPNFHGAVMLQTDLRNEVGEVWAGVAPGGIPERGCAVRL